MDRYVVMAGVYTLGSYPSLGEALTVAQRRPDATRVVLRGHKGGRVEFPVKTPNRPGLSATTHRQ